MAKLVTSALCNRVITDTQTNTVSLIDLIEDGIVPQFPTQMPPITTYLLWERQSEQEKHLTIRVSVVDTDNVQMLTQDIVEPFVMLRVRTVVQLAGLVVGKEGVYSIVVHQKVGAKWKQEGKLYLRIHLQSSVTKSWLAQP